MYNLIEYSDNCSNTSWKLYMAIWQYCHIWQYYTDELALDNHGNIVDFAGNSTTDSFNLKKK